MHFPAILTGKACIFVSDCKPCVQERGGENPPRKLRCIKNFVKTAQPPEISAHKSVQKRACPISSPARLAARFCILPLWRRSENPKCCSDGSIYPGEADICGQYGSVHPIKYRVLRKRYRLIAAFRRKQPHFARYDDHIACKQQKYYSSSCDARLARQNWLNLGKMRYELHYAPPGKYYYRWAQQSNKHFNRSCMVRLIHDGLCCLQYHCKSHGTYRRYAYSHNCFQSILFSLVCRKSVEHRVRVCLQNIGNANDHINIRSSPAGFII